MTWTQSRLVFPRTAASLFLACSLVYFLPTRARAIPSGFNIQGRLTDSNGVNRNGSYAIRVTIFDAATAGTALWVKTYASVTALNGNFQVVLGDPADNPSQQLAAALAGDPRYLEIDVLSGPGVPSPEPPLVPRQQLVSVPYALQAAGTPPPGSIVAFAGTTIPSGWAECNGAAASRTTYAALFQAIGVTWGAGDGSSTFNLPDFRGAFLRGWNHSATANTVLGDPDAAARVAVAVGGATGDNIGSYQADAFKAHTHTTSGFNGGDYTTEAGSNLMPIIGPNTVTGAAGGSETRPKNAYVMYIIRLF